MENQAGWTKPFHGVQHYGKYSPKTTWCTVENWGDFAILLVWFPGCGFSCGSQKQ